MTEIFPKQIQLCRVSSEWYQVIADNYLVSGASTVNCWYSAAVENVNSRGRTSENLEPGSLTLFVLDIKGVDYIVGGAFLLYHAVMTPDQCWRNLGVRNGFKTREDFFAQISREGGSPEENLSCYIVNSNFIFTHANMIRIPEEFSLHFEARTRMPLSRDEPFGLYLVKVAMNRRAEQLRIGHSHYDWPGLYLIASHTRSVTFAAAAFSRIMNMYGFRCAITGCATFVLLDLAHVRSIYDDSFHSPQNCVIMRSDLHRLFSYGYLTLRYDGEERVVVELSRNMLEVLGDYARFDGMPLNLPENRDWWPSRENLEWHREVRFENWLKQGEFTIADPRQHMHRRSQQTVG